MSVSDNSDTRPARHSNLNKVRIIALYIQHRDGVSDEDRRRLYQHARLTMHEQDAVNSLAHLGVRISRVRHLFPCGTMGIACSRLKSGRNARRSRLYIHYCGSGLSQYQSRIIRRLVTIRRWSRVPRLTRMAPQFSISMPVVSTLPATRVHDMNSNQVIKTRRRESNRSLVTKRNTSSHDTSPCFGPCWRYDDMMDIHEVTDDGIGPRCEQIGHHSFPIREGRSDGGTRNAQPSYGAAGHPAGSVSPEPEA